MHRDTVNDDACVVASHDDVHIDTGYFDVMQRRHSTCMMPRGSHRQDCCCRARVSVCSQIEVGHKSFSIVDGRCCRCRAAGRVLPGGSDVGVLALGLPQAPFVAGAMQAAVVLEVVASLHVQCLLLLIA